MKPQVIRTAEELKALDPEAVLYRPARGHIVHVVQASQISPLWDLPAVVVATGEQVRAAGKALEVHHDHET